MSCTPSTRESSRNLSDAGVLRRPSPADDELDRRQERRIGRQADPRARGRSIAQNVRSDSTERTVIPAAQLASGTWPIRRSSRPTSRRRQPRHRPISAGTARSAAQRGRPRGLDVEHRPRPLDPRFPRRQLAASGGHVARPEPRRPPPPRRRLRGPHWVHVHRPRAGHGRRHRVRLPLPRGIADADVTVHSWVRASHAELDVPLADAVAAWLAAEWPWERVHRPGR